MKRKAADLKVRKRNARRSRVRSSLAATDRPRLTVYRSARHIYAQIIDASTGRTITGVSSRTKGIDAGGSKMEAAKKVGAAIAEAARKHDIDAVVFNRNGFLYHGRVKALAEGAREAGLQF